MKQRLLLEAASKMNFSPLLIRSKRGLHKAKLQSSSEPTSKGLLRWLLPLIATTGTVLSGCSFGGSEPSPERVFLLQQVSCESSPAQISGGPTAQLTITATGTPSYLQRGPFVYAPAPRERRYYQFARWAVPPGDMIARAFEDAVQCSGIFGAVYRRGIVAEARYTLDITILDFYHDAQEDPGAAVIDLELTLVDSRKGLVIGSRRFVQRTPLTSFDADGAAAAFESGRGEILAAALEWLRDSVPPVPGEGQGSL